MTKKFIIINENGNCYSHFPDVTGNYATLCKLDGGDSDAAVNQSVAGVAKKVTCPDCIAIFDVINQFSKRDIDRKWQRPC